MTALMLMGGWLHVARDGRVDTRPLHPDHIRDLRQVLDLTAEYMGRGDHRQMTVIVDDPGALARYAPQAASLEGWSMAASGLQGWTTFRAPPRPAVHLGLLDALREDPATSPRKRRNPLFSGHETPGVIATRLDWYQQHTGGPYFMTPGVSGCEAIKTRWSRQHASTGFRRRPEQDQPWWGAGSRAVIGDPRQGAGDLLWARALTDEELTADWVHSYDLSGARLAAAGVADLPWYPLEEVAGPLFDESVAGYWMMRGEDLLDADPWAPPAWPAARRNEREVWLTTPAVKAMMVRGYNPPIMSAYLSLDRGPAPCHRGTRRWLYEWARTVDSARLTALAGGRECALHQAVQRTYKETIGMMQREGGSIFNRCAAHTVIDRQRVTLCAKERRVFESTGVHAFKADTDALWFVSDSPAKFPLDFGPGLGKWRAQYIVPMDVWLDGGHPAAKQWWAQHRERANA